MRKSQIIHSAIRTIADHGLVNLNFERVAKSLGIRRSHISYYYKNADELLNDILNEITKTARDVVGEHTANAKPGDLLAAYISSQFDWISRHKDHAKVILALFHYATHSSYYRYIFTKVREETVKKIMQMIEDSTDLKLRKPVLQHLAKCCHAMIQGYVVEHLSTDTPLTLEEMRDFCKADIKVLIQNSTKV